MTSAAAPAAANASTSAVPRGIRPGSARAWLMAVRPATLTAAVVPVAVGTACAHAADGLRLGPALAALFGSILIQIGTNFANDASDFEKGADTEQRLGPTRTAQSGLLTVAQLRVGIAVVFAVATALGLYLTWVGGWPIVVIGLASMAAGLAYTGGPYPLGYNGLGDVFVLIFFGFVAVCGTAYVQLGYVPDLAWWASAPVGALATAILVVNNLRDREGDAEVGKRTMAVRLGATAARAEYVLLIAIAYAVPIILATTSSLSLWVLLPLATAPIATHLTLALLGTRDGPAFNRCLTRTAQLLLLHGLAFAAGIAMAG